MKPLRLLLAAFVLIAAPAFAADVDGKWTGSMSTPGGDFPVGFTFKADGTTLNGTSTGPDGMEIKISNGKLDGNTLTFTISVDFGGTPLVINYKGTLADGQIKFVMDIMGMPLELTVKKA